MISSLSSLELNKARVARKEGNEGMARVLARRSAGFAIQEFISPKTLKFKGCSLSDLIKLNKVRKILPTSIHPALDRLSTRVGEDPQLPTGMDLIEDAQMVIDQLSLEDADDKSKRRN